MLRSNPCQCAPSTEQETNANHHECKFIYNGIDRIDSKLGYSADNVVSCCFFCNRAKMDRSFEDFMAWIAQLVAHHSVRTLPETAEMR